MAKSPPNPERVLGEWIERDLTELARAGKLPPAFEVDELVRRAGDVLLGGKNPILGGLPGVGKSSIIQELARRAAAGQGPPQLHGKRIVQISLRNRLSALAKAEQVRPEMQKLVDALIVSPDIVPFFRDLHVAYDHDLEPQLQTLALRRNGVAILGEGLGSTIDSMLEHTPDLEQHFVSITVEEPSLPHMERLLARWADEQRARGLDFSPDALSSALELAHRFLSRTQHPRRTVELLGQVGTLGGGKGDIGEDAVIERFFHSYRVPRFLIDPSVRFDSDATERMFRSRVLGQHEAVRATVRMISQIKAGLSDTRRPFGAFLFVGPTGVGKTHIAQLLAEFLFGSRERMVRLNMADHQAANDAPLLFGNPDGYNARARRGLLATRLMGHPFAVLLLDELEKAHPAVIDRLLQLIDEGAFINGANESVSCRSMIIIATSNAGSEVYRGQSIGFGGPRDVATLDRELDRLLLKHFRVEFLNRFDQVVHFHPLSRDDIRTIALRELEQLRDRAGIKRRGLQLEVDDAVLDWLTAHGYDPNFGARFLRRIIERNVTKALAEVIVRDAPPPGARLELTVRSGGIAARLVTLDAAAAAEDEVQEVRLPQGKTSEKVQALDKKKLLTEAARLVAQARPFQDKLEARAAEASKLLEVMNADGFWRDAAGAGKVHDQYRALDVAIQVERRLAAPVAALAELLERGAGKVSAQSMARVLEAAAQALEQRRERDAEEGPGAVWLVLRNLDPLAPAADWLGELADAELRWCRRLGLAAEIVAYGLAEETLGRIILDVEGPGAFAYLSMEEGTHRLTRKGRPDLRVGVQVIPKGDNKGDEVRLTALPRRTGLAGLEITCAARIDRGDRLTSYTLQGQSRATLAWLAADLEHTPPGEPSLALARTYAQGGSGARDPRTGAVAPRYKDVMAGQLDVFLEAWRAAD